MANYSVTTLNNHDKAELWQAFCATVVKLGESIVRPKIVTVLRGALIPTND